MARFVADLSRDHTAPRRVGVLLVNLGTPDAATPQAVRRYLAEFLSDPRVVEIPAAAWRPILHGVILRVRPAQSARKYAQIWTPEGSPLLIHSVRQLSLLKGALGERLKARGLPGDLAAVELGMTYGSPPIAKALAALESAGCDRVLVVPLYPQYASSATGSAFDVVAKALARMRRVPGVRLVDAFYDDPGYIRALARCVHDHWQREGRGERLVLSFHGVPKRTLLLGDPYYCQCQKTARLLTAELGLAPRDFIVSFQSRFGRAEWLQPYTAATVERLAKEGVRRLDVFCPGFVSDCLETLEEIGMEVKQTFLGAGGETFRAIPCLNEHPVWIGALCDLVLRHLEGWLDPPPDTAARELTQLRAKALGAAR